MKFKPVLLHFKFDNFASLPSDPGVKTQSFLQKDCNGYRWCLWLYPGGRATNDEPGWVNLFLCSKNTSPLDTKFVLLIKDKNGDIVVEEEKCEYNFTRGKVYGSNSFIKRSDILGTNKSILKDGALSIDVVIQVKDDKDHLYPPPSEHRKKMLNLLTSGEKSDTSFNVGGKVFRVHSLIIHAHAPILANHCDESINDISPEVFLLLLGYIYSGREPIGEPILKHGKALIDAANRYELIELKMLVENVLVRERIMTRENVADYILFADAQSCPLLKEYAITFFLVHYKEVLKSEHSKCLKDSGDLMSEIMLHMQPENVEDETMTVNELRKELGKRRLDVDGSKDALVSRLEEAKRQRTE